MRNNIVAIFRLVNYIIRRQLPLLSLACMIQLFLASQGFAAGGDIVPPWPRMDVQDGKQQATSSTVDSQGNVIVAGYRNLTGNTNDDYYTVKFKSDGSGVLWSAVFDKTGGSDQISDVTVDSNNDVIVTGTVWNGNNLDIHTIKYNGDNGTVIWQQTFNGAANGNDAGTVIAVDPNNDVYIGGYSQNGSGREDYLLLKYPSTGGAPVWQQFYSGPAGYPGSNKITSIAAGASGVAVTGQSWNGTVFESATMKYDLQGAPLWPQFRRYSNAPYPSFGKAVKLDASGDVIIAASASNGLDLDIYTAKYCGLTGSPSCNGKSSGEVIWNNTFDGHEGDEPKSIALDSAGNVYITGYSATASGHYDFYTSKIDGGDGHTLWSNIFDSGDGNTDITAESDSITLDSVEGAVFVTGYAVIDGISSIETLKYNINNGEVIWQQLFNGTSGRNSRSVGLGLTSTGDLLVAGWADNNASNLDYGALRYDRGMPNRPTSLNAQTKSDTSIKLTWNINTTNGDGFKIERCSGYGCSGFAQIMTVESGVATYTDTGLTKDTYYTYRVRAYIAANNSHYSNTVQILTTSVSEAAPAWAYTYNSSAGSDDYASAIAIGPDNNPVVTGASHDFYQGYSSGNLTWDYLTIKLDRANKSLIWSDRYDDPTNASDIATCVAVDNANIATVSGYATLNINNVDVNSLYTIRYQASASSPQALTADQYNGPGATDDRAVAIASAVDASNNVAVVGYGKNAAADEDIYLLKYNADGTRAWDSTPYNSGGDDVPSAVGFAPDGSIYVTGYSENSPHTDPKTYKFFTARYNGTNGNLIWSDLHTATANGDNIAAGLAFDANGDVYITGYATNAAGNKDIYTIKYKGANASAQRLWERAVDSQIHGDDRGAAVIVDPVDGNIIVAGSSTAQAGDSDYRVIRYTPGGDTIWDKTYLKPGSDENANAMAMDSNGNIYITGNTYNGTKRSSLTTKFDYLGNVAGNTVYLGSGSSDDTKSIAINAYDEIFVSGYTSYADTTTDLLVYKISPNMPTVPVNLSATAGYVSTVLNWLDSSLMKDGFNIERKEGVCSSTNNNPWIPLASVSASTFTYTDSGLLVGTTYCYHVQTYMNTGVVSRWKEVPVTTLTPGVPANISASATSTTRTTVSWSDQTSGETGYRVERCTGTDCTDGFTSVGTAAANATSFIDTTACQGTTYRYQIFATGSGWESTQSAKSSNITTPAVIVPVLIANRTTEAEIDLSWSASNGDVTGYVIERCSGTNCTEFEAIKTIAAGTLVYKNSGLNGNTTYAYRVRPYKNDNCSWPSIYSNTATVTTTINSPSSLTATATSTTTANLLWTDNTASESGFIIEKCVGAGCVFSQVGSVGSNVTSFTDSTLCPGDSATYRIKATRGSATLSNSNGGCWTRRKPVTINNFQPNFQIRLNVPYDSDMLASFADVRFMDTSANGEVPYWIENKTDGVSATIWIKTGSNNSISMYFGNASATDSGNGASVFEFFDDFSSGNLDTDKWTSTGATSLSNGALRIDSGAVYSKATVTQSTQDRVFEMKSQWLNAAASYSGLNIANSQSTQDGNAGSSALAYFITDGGTTANLLPFGATGTAASYNIAGGTVTSTVSTSNALYNPFVSHGQNTRKPASGVWSPPGGGNISRIHVVIASESCCDIYYVYNASGQMIYSNKGNINTWVDITPTTGIYSIFHTDGSVQTGFGGNVSEVVVSGISAVDALNNYRIEGFEFRDATAVSYFVKQTDYSEIVRQTYTGTWNAPSFLWLGYYTGAAAGTTDIDDMQVDWVRIRKYAATEPTASLGVEESSTCFTFASTWDGAYSNITLPITTASPSSPVLNAVTRAHESQINISWSDNNADRTGFRLWRCSGAGCSSGYVQAGGGTISSLSYNDTGLVPDTSYTYYVETFKSATCGWPQTSGQQTSGQLSAITTLYEPNNVTVTANNTTQNTVAWADRTGSETGFKILRCETSGCTPDPTPIYTTAANATSYIDTSVKEGTTYNYQVVATNSTKSWNSPSAKVERAALAAATPSAPTVSWVSEAKIRLVWSDASNNDESGYKVYRCTDSGSGCTPTVQIGNNLAANTTSFDDTTVNPGDTYVYRVSAFKTATNPWSNGWEKISASSVSIKATIKEPNNFSAAADNTTQVTLGWADRTATESGFEIWRCANPPCTTSYLATVGLGGVSYPDTSACNGMTYMYQVKAINTTVPWYSDYASLAAPVTTVTAVAPTTFTATQLSESSVKLDWNDPNSDEDGYKVERCNGDSTYCAVSEDRYTVTYVQPANTITYTNSGLAPNSTYTYRVRAYKNSTCPWNRVSATQTITTTVPAPSGLSLQSLSSTAVKLTWTNTTLTETGFVVERCSGAGCSDFSALVASSSIASRATTFTDTSVCGGISYTYRIKSKNASLGWESGYSNLPTISSSQSSASYPNLLMDPNFEDAATGWSAAVDGGSATGSSIDAAVSYNGTRSLKVIGDAATVIGRSQAVAVVPGQRYVLSGYVKSTLTAGSAVCNVIDAGITSDPGFSIAANDPRNNTWVNLNEVVTIPEGTTSVSVQCFATSSAVGTVYFDALSFNSAFAITATGQATPPVSPLNEAKINLAWPDVSTDETGYTILKCVAGVCSQIAQVGPNVLTYTDNTYDGVTSPGASFNYQVLAYKTATCGWASPASAVATGTTAAQPSAPANLAASPVNTTKIHLSWTNNTSSETNIVVERCEGPSCTFIGTPLVTLGAGANYYDDTSVKNGTPYSYRVYAKNTTLSPNWSTTYSNTATGMTPAAIAPVLNVPTPVSDTRIDLSWSASNADVSNYIVVRDGVDKATLSSATTVYQDTGVLAGNTYSYQIRAVKTGVAQAWSAPGNSQSATPSTPAPTLLTVAVSGSTQLNLAWHNNTSSESEVRIERCMDSGSACSNFAQIDTVSSGVQSYQDTAVVPGKTFRYQVRAANTTRSWTSPYSNIANNTTTSLPVPTVQAATSATRNNEYQITLNWTAVSNVSGYNVYYCTGSGCTPNTAPAGNPITGATSNSFQHSGLNANTIYRYLVKAYKQSSACTTTTTCESAASVTTNDTNTNNPAVPTVLTATAVNSTSVQLAWQDNTVAETAYSIERCTGAGCSDFLAINDSLASPAVPNSKGQITWTDTPVSAITSYSYRVRAKNPNPLWSATVPANYSGYSNTATVTTPNAGPPNLMTESHGTNKVTLTWGDNCSGATQETGFNLLRCSGSGCIPTTPAYATYSVGTGSSVVSVDTAACSGQSYVYQLNPTGALCNYPSVTVPVTMRTPVDPTLTAVARTTDVKLSLSWSDDPNNNAANYTIERCAGTGCSNFSPLATSPSPLPGTATGYDDTSVLPDMTYSYRIHGNGPVIAGCTTWQTTSNILSQYTNITVPSLATPTVVNSTRIDLAWSDADTSINGWKLERCTGAACSDFVELSAGLNSKTPMSYSDTGVVAGTTYQYRIRATGASGGIVWVSGYSATVSAATPALAAPASLTAVRNVTNQTTEIDLAWNSSSPDLTGFIVERCTGEGCMDFAQLATVTPATTTAYANTALDSSQGYCYRVKGYKTASTTIYTDYSNIACNTTLMSAPDTLTATALDSQAVLLSWREITPGQDGVAIESQIWNGSWVQLATLGGSESDYVDMSGISPQGTYTYRVRAWRGSDYSMYSNTATVTVPAYVSGDGSICVANGSPDQPQITSEPVKTATEGIPYTYAVVATAKAGSIITSYDLSVRPIGMTMDPATHVISWTPAYTQSGDKNVTVRVTDSLGRISDQGFVIKVGNDIQLPRINSSAVTKCAGVPCTVGQSYSYQVAATDPEGRALSYSLTTAPAGMTISPSGRISWTAQSGTNDVTVSVDNGTKSATQSFTVPVTTYHPLAITSAAPASAINGATYSYQVVVTNTDNYPLSYSLTSAPAGMSISPSGRITWVPVSSQANTQVSATVWVTDGVAPVSQPFTIDVAQFNMPVIVSTPVTTASEGVSYSYNVSATSPIAATLTYSLTTPPTGMSINASTGAISWTPAQGQGGSVPVTVNVQAGTSSANTATQTFTIAVPVITSTPGTAPVRAGVGVAYSYQVAVNKAGRVPAPVYSLDTKPSWMTINSSTGLISGTPDAGGAVTVTVRAAIGSEYATQTYTLNVVSFTVNPTTTAAVGNVYVTPAITANDPASGTISYGLTAPAGASINPSSGLITWTPAANQTGTVSMTVTASVGGVTISKTSAISVLSITSTAVTTSTVTTAYSYQVTTTGAPSGYSLTDKPAWMSINGSGLITGTPDAVGNIIPVTVQVTTAGGYSVAQSFNLAAKPKVNAPAVTTAAVGSTYSSVVTASPAGTYTYGLSSPPSNMSINATSGTITWTTPVAGNTSVTATATTSGVTGTVTFNISGLSITDGAAMTAGYVGAAYTYKVNITGTASTYTISGQPSGMTIDNSGNINWATPVANTYSNIHVTATTIDGYSAAHDYSLTISSASPPPAPAPTGNSGCTTDSCSNPCSVTPLWGAVTIPGGHTPNYKVELSTDPTFASIPYNSGWISATSWPTPQLDPTTWYWRVWSKDTVNGLVSATATTSSFPVHNGYDQCACDPASCGSSCPFVFTWDGNKYNYITDLQGPQIFNSPSLKRSVKLFRPVSAVLDGVKTDKDNRYRLMIWESLQEMTYLDEVKLLAVDYPKGYEILSSDAESTILYGYMNPFKIYTIKDPVLPVTATDMKGRDILAKVRGVDDNPATVEDVLVDNFYTFDFGVIRHPEHAKLLIDGWTVYGQTKVKVDKSVQPFIEVVDKNGKWVKVKSIGNASGDLKTMVVDLSNIFLSSDQRIRLHVGVHRSRWIIDRIRLDDSAPVALTVREIKVSSAVLQSRGNAITKHTTLSNRFMLSEQAQPPVKAKYLGYGRFTKYGDVSELLTAQDDMFVIMRFGDALDVRFPAVAQPPKSGMTRGFVIRADLYYKGYKHSNKVEPLPFHGMSDYPYPANESYPQDKKHRDYLDHYNTREYKEGSSKIEDMHSLLEPESAYAAELKVVPVKEDISSVSTNKHSVPKTVVADAKMTNDMKSAHVVTQQKSPDSHSSPSLWQTLCSFPVKFMHLISIVQQWLRALVGL